MWLPDMWQSARTIWMTMLATSWPCHAMPTFSSAEILTLMMRVGEKRLDQLLWLLGNHGTRWWTNGLMRKESCLRIQIQMSNQQSQAIRTMVAMLACPIWWQSEAAIGTAKAKAIWQRDPNDGAVGCWVWWRAPWWWWTQWIGWWVWHLVPATCMT